MAIDIKFIKKFSNITSRAALAASYLVGKKDKIAADKAAVDSMRSELNKMNMTGEIVIGEGTLDEAPMLYTGEVLGNKNVRLYDGSMVEWTQDPARPVDTSGRSNMDKLKAIIG